MEASKTWSEMWLESHTDEDLSWARAGIWSHNCCQDCRDGLFAARCGAQWIVPHWDRIDRRQNPGGWVNEGGAFQYDGPLEAVGGANA